MPPGDFLEEHSEAELAVQALLGVLLDVAPDEEGGSFADCAELVWTLQRPLLTLPEALELA